MSDNYFKVKGLVLKNYNCNNSSKTIHFFTRDFGKIELLAQGARRTKSYYGYSLEVMSLAEIVYYSNGFSKSTIKEAYLENCIIYNLNNYKNYLSLLSLANLLNNLLPFNHKYPEIYDITLSFRNLFLKNYNSNLINNFYFYSIFKIIKYLGYKLDFKINCECKEKSNKKFYFIYNNGNIICEKCYKELLINTSKEEIPIDIINILPNLNNKNKLKLVILNKKQIQFLNEFIKKIIKFYFNERYENEILYYNVSNN